MNIQAVLERARARLGDCSERELCRQLAVTHRAFAMWRDGQGWPSDETMLRLSAIAGLPNERALLMLNTWRSPPRVAAIYSQMLNRLPVPPAQSTRAPLSKRPDREQVRAKV